MVHLSGLHTSLPKQNCDSVGKEGTSHSKTIILDRCFCIERNGIFKNFEGWGYSTMVECLPTMHKVLGLIGNIANKEEYL
jgi:hypothetical protein